jgi:hypothetical protein
VVTRRHAGALVVVGLVELSAWAQVPASGERTTTAAGTNTPPATAVRAATTAVAAFPDVAKERPKPAPDRALELLATDPYAAELAFREAQRNLFGDALEDEDPYAEALRLVNPYTGNAVHRGPSNPYALRRPRPVVSSAYRASAAGPDDLANPYAMSAARPVDLSNPYTRTAR